MKGKKKKEARREEEKKKDEEERLSFRRVLSNMLFAMRTIWGRSPLRVIYEILKSVLGSLCGFLSGTWLTRYVLNSLENHAPFAEIAAVSIGVMAVIIVYSIVNLIFDKLINPILRLRVRSYINRLMLEKAMSVELSCYEDTEFYEKFTLSVPEAYGWIDDGAMMIVRYFCQGITGIIANASIIIIINPVLLALALIPLITNLLFARRDNRLHYDFWSVSKSINRDRDYIDRVFYLGDFAKELRMSEIHLLMLKRFRRDLDDFIRQIKKFGARIIVRGFLKSLADFTLVYFGCLLYSAYCLLVTHTMQLGDALVITGAITAVSASLGFITHIYSWAQRHAMFLDNARKFLSYEIKLTSPKGAPETDRSKLDIEMKNVSFGYGDGSDLILQNINLKIAQGERIAVVGTNGAGKTTLAKLLMRLYDVNSGKILCGGRDIREYDLESYRSTFGVIFQDYRIFAMSVRDNVTLGEECDDESVIAALKSVGVYERIMELPLGLDTPLTREYSDDGVVLSGGEYQKICIARVFARNAGIVILDEPSSALDPISEYNMYENMLSACAGRSVVFISHRLSSAVLADRVILLADGGIAEVGSHRELIEADGLYAKMFKMQSESYAEEAEI